MKKIFLFSLILIAAISANAQMDNLTNLSAEWMRTGARNAATNSTDIVVYNPAGLIKLTEGFHINFSNQSLFRKPTHSYDLGLGDGEKTFTQKGNDLFIPELFLSYNKNKFAFFGAAYISGGGATLNYPNGSITTDLITLGALQSTGGAYTSAKDQNLKAGSMYLTFLAGAAYSVSKNISFSLALRNVNVKNTAQGSMTLSSSPFDLPDMPLALNYEEAGSGTGAVIGLNISCNENLTIAAHYETKVNLDLKTKQIKDDFGLTVDGQLNRRDLPALGAIGISYEISPAIRSYTDFNYYFQKNADWGNSTAATNNKSNSSLAGDAYGIGAGVEYLINEKLTASFGGGYTNFLYADKNGYYTHTGTFEVMYDDNANINTGFAYQLTKKLRVNAGYMHTFWKKDQIIKAELAQPLDVNVKVNNSLNAIALGVEISF